MKKQRTLGRATYNESDLKKSPTRSESRKSVKIHTNDILRDS
jgi:hypothetical protein